MNNLHKVRRKLRSGAKAIERVGGEPALARFSWRLAGRIKEQIREEVYKEEG